MSEDATEPHAAVSEAERSELAGARSGREPGIPASSEGDKALTRPDSLELVVAGTQALGQDPRLGDRRHEVRIGAPAREHVHVQMTRDAGTRRVAEVGTEVR